MYACFALALIPAVVYAQKVTTDFDHAAPFASYRTYAWAPGAPSLVSLTEQRIHSGIETQLQAKALRLAENNPSLYVASFVLTRVEPQVIASGFDPWWRDGGGFAATAAQTYVQGTLIVDLYDAATRKMVWRGVATATASDKPSKNSAKIDRTLARMFERYPPSVISARR
jgi:hypothetical protein